MSKLTKREKFLLWLLSVVVVVYVMMTFLILPAYQKNNELSLTEAELFTQKELAVMTQGQLAQTEQGAKDAKAALDAALGQVSLAKQDEEIERLITGLFLNNGLAPTAMSIARNGGETDAAEEDGKDEDAAASTTYLEPVYVVVTAQCSQGEIGAFLAAAEQTPGLAVLAYSAQPVSGTLADGGDTHTAQFSLILYSER